MARGKKKDVEAKPNAAQDCESRVPSLSELFWIFLGAGSTAFGGYMSLVAAIERKVVVRNRLLTQSDLLDGLSLASLLPGPVAVNTAAYAGFRIRGLAGALIAIAGVVLPSLFLMTVLTIAYEHYGSLPAVSRALGFIVPVVAAVILAAALRIGRKNIHSWREALLMLLAFAAVIKVHWMFVTLAVIAGSAMVGLVWPGRVEIPTAKSHSTNHTNRKSSIVLVALLCVAGVAALLSPWRVLFSTFAGMSFLLFGGGYVIIPMIHSVVVSGHGWVTSREFVDAITLSQIMPGPVLISAAFIGYRVSGIPGDLLATFAIFVPPALLMVAASHVVTRVQSSHILQRSLTGIRPAVSGMVVSAAVVIERAVPSDNLSASLFVVTLLFLIWTDDRHWRDWFRTSGLPQE